MKRTYLLAPAALLAMSAAPALAGKGHADAASGASAPAEQTASAAAPDKAERKTCRTFQNSATRLKAERVCLTKDDWKKFDAIQ